MAKRRDNRFFFYLQVLLAAITLGPDLVYGGKAQDPGPDAAPAAPGIAQEAPPPEVEGFEVKRVGSRYEPVARFDHLVFRLPGTRMTFAGYT